jgi:hypothetical protein
MSRTLTAKRWRSDRYEFQWVDAGGMGRSLAGCGLYFGVKLTPSGQLTIAAALGAGVLVTDLDAGKFVVVLPPIAKIGLSSLTTYYWDCLVVTAAGDLLTVDGGVLEVEESITPGALPGAMPINPANLSFHPEITTLDGGGVTALDGYDTATLSLPFLFVLYIAGQRQEWKARARGQGERPDDPNVVPVADRQKVLPVGWSAENNVMWERVF